MTTHTGAGPGDQAAQAVLVLEDEPMIAMMVEDMLLDLGHGALVADGVDEALALLAEPASRPCAAILDVNLGTQQCWPVARELEALGVPYAIATGGADRAPADLTPGAALPKPYTLADLDAALSRLIGEG